MKESDFQAYNVDEDGKFIHPFQARKIKGQKVPGSFEFDNHGDWQEGEVIGRSSTGQTLYWEQGSIVARG